jgi:hypothetical protein
VDYQIVDGLLKERAYRNRSSQILLSFQDCSSNIPSSGDLLPTQQTITSPHLTFLRLITQHTHLTSPYISASHHSPHNVFSRKRRTATGPHLTSPYISASHHSSHNVFSRKGCTATDPHLTSPYISASHHSSHNVFSRKYVRPPEIFHQHDRPSPHLTLHFSAGKNKIFSI